MSFQKKWALLPLLTFAGPLLLFAQQGLPKNTHQLTRRYKSADSYRYRMTTNVVHNGKWQSTIVAVCELHVVNDSSNIPYDEVKWISKKVFTAKDTTEHAGEINGTPSYRISLHEKGKLDIPPILQAGMTGEITDLNTFFVAISPKLGITNLQKAGDSYKKPEPVHGNFANGKDILKGNDCLEVTTTLQQTNVKEAIVQTSFLPPSANCFDYLTAEMKTPVAGDTINNFQMVRRFTGDKVNVFYGKEVFNISSTISKRDGKLLKANMTNDLQLKMKIGCEEDYENCQTTMPYTISRSIQLELIPWKKE